MVPKEYLIIGGCNAVFIIITIIEIFTVGDSVEIVAILSIIWCLINAILALYLLRASNAKSVYSSPGDLSPPIDRNHPIINDDEVEIFVEDGNDTTGNAEIEMQSTAAAVKRITQKYETENKQRRELQYQNTQILEEYEKYKKENEDTARDNLQLIQKCKAFETEITQLKASNAEMMQQLEYVSLLPLSLSLCHTTFIHNMHCCL